MLLNFFSTVGYAQEFPFIDPNDLLAVWDFNDSSSDGKSRSLVRGIELELVGSTSFSSGGEGHTGQSGDRALDFGVSGGLANPTHARVLNSSPTGITFIDLLNKSNADDVLSVSFWQRWHSGQVANSSSVWFVSPSAGSGDRGYQAHVPWGNGTVYFDTSGCCDVPVNRLNGKVDETATNLDWGEWHHVALVKNHGAKQVWINGKRALNQTTGADPLLRDITGLILGQAATEPQYSFHGLMDDVAVFGVALLEAHIIALASGTPPLALSLPADQQPPRIENLFPADGTRFYPTDGGLGFKVSTVTPNRIESGEIRLILNGEDVSSNLSIRGDPSEWRVEYEIPLEEDLLHTIKVVVMDDVGRSSSSEWSIDTFDPLEARADIPIDVASLGVAINEGSSSSTGSARLAIDGLSNTYSESADEPGAFWELTLSRAVLMTRIEILSPNPTRFSGVMEGVVIQVSDLKGRTLFELRSADIEPGGLWSIDIPDELYGRTIRLGLDEGQRNGAGSHRVVIAEVRVFGDPTPEFGPIRLKDISVATQNGQSGLSMPASNGIDGDYTTYSQTADEVGSQWLLSLDRVRPIHTVEIVNRADGMSARMGGLYLEILDSDSNTVDSTKVANPGSGGTWSYDPPAGTEGRFIRVSLLEGEQNGTGDHVISFAEMNLYTAKNYALGAESYMMRFNENLPPTANGNDGNYATHTETTRRAVGSYWEVDLGEEHALNSVRVIAADGFQRRMIHTTVRLYGGAHDSVFSQHLGGNSSTFDVPLPGAILARYVRVGFENKERSESGTFWHLGLKELQAFGRPANEVGLIHFEASESESPIDGPSRLVWREEGLNELLLYPEGKSLGSLTGISGEGVLEVSPMSSIEYTLVGTESNRSEVRYLTIEVDGKSLPPQINEFVANNRLSLRDGRRASPDWIEIRNPNNTILSLMGYGLSDDPERPMKWVFPDDVTIDPHGFLIIFASGRKEAFDAGGHLHSNFRLNTDGESLQLTAPDGLTVLDRVESFPAQREDLAFGRTLQGNWTFMDPTPNAVNLSITYEGWLPSPVFSRQRGFQAQPFTLTLDGADEASTVFVSTDGSEPILPFTGPLRISGNTTVRAYVHRSGYKSPRTQTHSYLYVEDTISAPNMDRGITGNSRFATRLRRGLRDLPSICISVPDLPDDWNEREASVEVFLPGADPVQANAGVTRFGGAWTNFSKKNYRLKFRSKYGARKLKIPLFSGFDHGILATDSFDELDLRGGGHDMSSRGFYMSARFSEDTLLEMGSLNPHGRFVHVYFNGIYWGQYHARERLTDAFLADYLGGQTEDYVNVRGNDNAGSSFVPGTPDPVHREPWETVRLLRGSYENVRKWLDVAHLIDFMLMWNFGNAESEYRSAGPISPGSGFKFWLGDADGHLRSASDRTGNPGPGGLFGALVSERQPEFMTLLADRTHRHLFNNGAMTPARNITRLEERMSEIRDSLVVESARWGFRTPESWENAARNVINNLFPTQTDDLISRLRSRGLYPSLDAPVLSRHGGMLGNGENLTITAASGEIYYTLDGKDPRLQGGGIAPSALSAGGEEAATLVNRGETWRFSDSGQAPGADWMTLSFDDADWKGGRAPLGYGDAGMATALDFGGRSNNKFTSYYFRHEFNLEDPSALEQLKLFLVRDDGAVVYLNGEEVARDNLPIGNIDYDTFALSAAGGNDETSVRSFTVSSKLLRSGRNILAAEVHQASLTSSDIRFDLWLQGGASFEIALSGETLMKARVFDGTNWSALTEAVFVEQEAVPPLPGDLMITELNYNPDGSDEFEFIEIMNLADKAVDLSGMKLDGGVEFLFPRGIQIAAGGFVMIVENEIAFKERYLDTASPYFYPEIMIAGEWSGRLNDNGERIVLVGANGQVLVSLEFQNKDDWPSQADGQGSSLELRDPVAAPASLPDLMAYLDQGVHWQASPMVHGSPGRISAATAPSFTSLNDLLWPVFISLSIDGSVNDPGFLQQPLKYSATGLPAGLVIDSETGNIKGVATTEGEHQVTVRVLDRQSPGRLAEKSFILTITSPFELSHAVTETTGSMRFVFQAISGESYEVQFTDNLSAPDWKTIERIENVNRDVRQVSIPLDSSVAQRYIRVMWIR